MELPRPRGLLKLRTILYNVGGVLYFEQNQINITTTVLIK